MGGGERARRHGVRLARAGLEMGGKTGTAQVIGPRRTIKAGADKSKLQDNAWFAGFAPVEDPQMVVVVFVENGGHGNLAAAPLAKMLFEASRNFDTPPAAAASAASRPAGPVARRIARGPRSARGAR